MPKRTLPLRISIAEKYEPAMAIADQTAADNYLKVLVRHNVSRQQYEGSGKSSFPYALWSEKVSLGWFAQRFYDQETQERVGRLFRL